jgi:GNAT superfamily N-acetyltransferase
MGRITVSPVTQETWDDFAQLFAARGSPHYCWCAAYRFRRAHQLGKTQRKAAMRKLVSGGTPIGVVAYDGDEPVGWCSIAPRETYVKLERSRTMPRATPPSTATWTVFCFFLARSHRQQGITRALLRGAIVYARAQGAEVIEGYPFDTANITSTHRGHSSTFAAARFVRDGNRWSLRLGRGAKQ